MSERKTRPATTKTAKRKVFEANTPMTELAGFGSDVVKIIDATSGEIICYIGLIEGVEKIYFTKPISFDILVSACEVLNKKKMKKALAKGNLEKAKNFAERRFAKA